MSPIQYRADIDGIRAIAVLSIVLFHFGISRFFPGGFVGVDIFFVISGFLITSIIVREAGGGRYSTLRFYSRRIRRIVPALTVMMLGCMIWSLFKLFPSEIFYQNKSILSSLFFVSNLRFFYVADYFDPVIQYDLMLHTWSLSVEEQFYIFFPLLMLVLTRLPERTLKIAVATLAAASFVACVLTTPASASAAFYLMPFRAWELLLGSMLAIGCIPPLASRGGIQVVGTAGVVMVVSSVLCLQGEDGFPGYIAALPAVGAAALLYAGGCSHPSWANRLLAFAPLRFIGLISYSLYLWHWPMLLFTTHELLLQGSTKLILLAAAFVIATLSWYFVERPFRHAEPAGTGRFRVIGVGAATTIAIAIAALIAPAVSGAAWPVPAAAERALSFQYRPVDAYMRKGSCFLSTGSNALDFYQKDACLKASVDRPNILILGDSHAAHLWSGYHARYPTAMILQATASGCKPVSRPSGLPACVALIEFASGTWLPRHRVDAVVLAARWDGVDVRGGMAMAQRVRRFADRVIIVGPLPTYRQAVPRLVARALVKGVSPDRLADAYRLPDALATDALFRREERSPGIFYVSLVDLLCKPLCRTTTGDGTPLQFDYGHLTEKGSAFLVERIRQRMTAEQAHAGQRLPPNPF